MWFEVAILVFGGFAAAFVAGAAGFGDALIASAIWLLFFSPIEIVPVIVACFFLMQLGMLLGLRRSLDFRNVWPFIIGGAIGVPLGVQLLTMIDPVTFKIVAGVFLVFYGVIMLKLSNLPPFTRGGKGLDGIIGWIGGVLGGFAGLSGFIPGLWATQRGWPRAQARGVTQPYIMSMHGFAFAWLASAGTVTAQSGMRIAITLPAVALGCWFGIKLYHRFDERRFRQVVLCVLVLAGAILFSTSIGV